MASATIATTPYRPPLSTGTPTTTESSSAINYGTSTAQPGNTYTYLYYFIVPYLDAHVLSPPSWRYAYIFWIFIPVFLAIWTAIFQLNRFYVQRSRTPLADTSSSLVSHKSDPKIHPFRWIRALFMRRLMSPISNTSPHRFAKSRLYLSDLNVGHVVTLVTFTVILAAISLVGDDYISPTTCTWGGRCPVQVFKQGPPKSTYAPISRRSRARRADLVPPPQPVHLPYHKISGSDDKILLPRATALSLNPDGWAPFTEPLLSAPNTNVPRTMWTLSSRFGLIAYAMIPLVVSIGLKSWPFNIFATPWLTHYGFDQTSIIHRWTGRLIWVWSTIHTITFAIQLSRDINPYGQMILKDVWQYYRFNWGVAAYIALTITVCFSFKPLRNRYYEFFYCSHVILSIVFLVGCIIHYEPLWAWATIGLALWGAERACRFTFWLWFNGFFSSPTKFCSHQPATLIGGVLQSDLEKPAPVFSQVCPQGLTMSAHSYPPSLKSWVHGPTNVPSTLEGQLGFPPEISHSPLDIVPSGFALVQVLPGHTLRITHAMVKEAKWQIGQYVLLCVPSVSWWQSHPYTICCSSSVSDFNLSQSQSSAKELVLLLRARQGFSKKLYEFIINKKNSQDHLVGPSRMNGVLVRCQISRPLGSSGRVMWDSMDSLIIVCGGSGISFGISALEEICFKMRARSPEKQGMANFSGTRVSRVRLLWIFREYAHLSWAALALKRCLAMVSSEELQIDLHVSNALNQKNPSPKHQEVARSARHHTEVTDSQALLIPPHPAFLRMDSDSDVSNSSPRNSFTGSLATTESINSHGIESHDTAIGFTDFEGENHAGSAVERVISDSVKREGRRRRRNTLTRAKEHNWKLKNIFTNGSKVKGGAHDNSNKTEHSSDHSQNGNPGQIPCVEHFEEERPWQDEVFRQMGVDFLLEDRLAIEELSELIQTGRPRLRKILRTEVEKSLGKTLVACCGPETLNSYIRSLVSDQLLHPGDGQSHKYIDIYAEDFSY